MNVHYVCIYVQYVRGCLFKCMLQHNYTTYGAISFGLHPGKNTSKSGVGKV